MLFNTIERECQATESETFPAFGPLMINERAVGGHRKVSDSERGDPGDNVIKPGMKRRFAAGQTNAVDAQIDAEPGDSDKFINREQPRSIKEPDIRIHAVDAPEVAPIGDGETQIADDAAVRIDEATIRTITFARPLCLFHVHSRCVRTRQNIKLDRRPHRPKGRRRHAPA